jgi:hypothetical protein
MNLGAQNKRNTVLAAVLLVIAVGVFLRMVVFPIVFAKSSGVSAVGVKTTLAEATQKNAQHPRRGEHHLPAVALTPSLDPRLRLDLLEHEQESRYNGNGRNIFAENSEPIPTPIAPGLKGVKPTQTGPTKFAMTQPPPPPPINLRFFGFESRPGEPKRIFLTQTDGNVLVAHEGDIVAERYKIVHIGPTSVEIEDVLSNSRQSIPLTQS